MKHIITSIFIIGLLSACGTSQKTVKSDSVIATSSSEAPISNTSRSSEKENKIISRPIYNASETKVYDLIHTAIHAKFDWKHSQMEGLTTVTCSPHFYATDSLILDAQEMKIFWVKMNGKELAYRYTDGKKLKIGLGKIYYDKDTIKVTIKYIAQPEKVKEGDGTSAITEAKGLYFINPLGKDPYQMPQIWTQGETESSSVWYPTLDATNQKTTQEIWMTVDAKYKTLSNGKLISSKANGDGTRTDYWRRDLPASPYLSMMAVGEFSIIKDFYTKDDGTVIPVFYYVEPQWADDARAIFGNTPEMIKFYSDLLGIEYVWPKYNQIVVREYVSGAMENTGATVLGDFLYQTKRELIDDNNEKVIAHELFHHWFGDLVTAESWANITLNESFADYGQYLWDEYKYGIDQADYNAQEEANQYYLVANRKGSHDLVYYDYDYELQVFDVHSYNKGGRILHMLRTFVGDSAFFKGLHLYLEENKFEAAEVANFRMAMEEITGQDLNWFFNQWYFAAYHPVLKITQEISDGIVTLKIQQKQDLNKAPLYKLPLNVAVYANDKRTIYPIVVDKNINTFTFPFEGSIQNIIVDADRALLADKNYEKPNMWYVFQYDHGRKYIDRKEALIKVKDWANPRVQKMVKDALKDKFWAIRKLALEQIDHFPSAIKTKMYTTLIEMAKSDKNSHVRGKAVVMLGNQFLKGGKHNEVQTLLIDRIENDTSFLVMARALFALSHGEKVDLQIAMDWAKKLEKEKSTKLKAQIMSLYATHGDISNLDFMAATLNKGEVRGRDAMGGLFSLTGLLKKQPISVQEKYYPVYERLSRKGGAYVSRVLPMAIMQLEGSAQQKMTQLKDKVKILEDSGKNGEATLIQGKVKAAKVYIEKLQTLAK